MKKRLMSAALAATMTAASLTALNSSSYFIGQYLDEEVYQQIIDEFNTKYTPTTPEQLEIAKKLMDGRTAPCNLGMHVLNVWLNDEGVEDIANPKSPAFLLECVNNGELRVSVEGEMAYSESKEILNDFLDELGLDEYLEYKSANYGTYWDRPGGPISFDLTFKQPDNALNEMLSDKAFAMIKERFGDNIISAKYYKSVTNFCGSVELRDLDYQLRKYAEDEVVAEFYKDGAIKSAADLLECWNYVTDTYGLDRNAPATYFEADALKNYVASDKGIVDGSSVETFIDTANGVTYEPKYLGGDSNTDKELTIADATLILQSIGNPDKYALSRQGAFNADICNTGDGVSPLDALEVQKILANKK